MYGFGAWALTLLISFNAVDPMKDADQAEETIKKSPLENLKDVCNNKAFRVVLAYEFTQGFIGGSNVSLNMFYFMYVSKLPLGTASFLVLPWAMSGIFLALAMVPIWLKFFKTRTPTRTVQVGMVLHGVISPIVYFVLPALGFDYTFCFFLDFALVETVKSCRDFWKASALARVVR